MWFCRYRFRLSGPGFPPRQAQASHRAGRAWRLVQQADGWLPEAGTLRISFTRPLLKGEETDLHIEYSGTITEWPAWSANVITEDWIEIGLYLPWFPYNFDEFGPFTFDVNLALDSAYEVRGYGSTERIEEGWHFERTLPTNDIVVVASKDLETTSINSEGRFVQLHHPGLADSVTRNVVGSAMLVLNTYSD